MRAYAGYDEENKRWLLLMLLHHLVGDQTTEDVGFMCDVDYVTFDEKQTLFQHSSTSWDALTLELWPALVHGGKCVLHARETITANDLRDAIQHHGVTLLWLPSALFTHKTYLDIP